MLWIILIVLLICAVVANGNSSKRALVEVEQRKVKRVRICPICAEQLQLEAILCRFCGEDLPLLTDSEREEVEDRYIADIESLDPNRRTRRSNFARKMKNENDWKNT